MRNNIEKEYDIMVAGHLCIDVTPAILDEKSRELSEIMSPGKLVNVGAATISTGGAVSNTGIAADKLGNRMSFCAQIGDDVFGRLIIEYLNRYGNSDGVKIRSDVTSSYSIVIAPPNIDRIFLHCPGSNDYFSAESLDVQLLKKCRHFHFGYPPLMRSMYENNGDELLKIFELAKHSGMTTSCDMALPDPNSDAGRAPWISILEKVLPFIDIFLPSAEEAFYMLNPDKFMEMKLEHGNVDLIEVLEPDEYSTLAGELLDFGTKMVSLKCGNKGWYFRTSDKVNDSGGMPISPNIDNWLTREIWCPAFVPSVIKSATGAGDCSIAGFLTGFLKGLDIEQCLKAAMCLGWQNLHEVEAVSGVKTWEETFDLIKNPPPINDCEMPGTWLWDETLQVYYGPEDTKKI